MKANVSEAASESGSLPDPISGEIQMVSWAYIHYGHSTRSPSISKLSTLIYRIVEGNIVVCKDRNRSLPAVADYAVEEVHSENELIHSLITLIHSIDPDVIVSYEMQSNSLGYLQERSLLAHSSFINQLASR